MEVFLKFMVNVLLIPVVSVLNGWVLTILWAWFVVPTFSAPTLRLVPAIGLSLVVGYLTKQVDGQKDERTWVVQLGTALFTPVFALACGWIIHLFL